MIDNDKAQKGIYGVTIYLEVPGLKTREGNPHFEIQLLACIHRLSLPPVWLSQFLLQECAPYLTLIAVSPTSISAEDLDFSSCILFSVDKLISRHDDPLQSHVVLEQGKGLTMAAVISGPLIAEKRALNTCWPGTLAIHLSVLSITCRVANTWLTDSPD